MTKSLPALITFAVVEAEKVVQALAATLLPLLVAEVVGVWVDPQEPAGQEQFRQS